MTTKEKYELIDKTKVSAKVLEILEKMEKASSNFTNAEVNSRVDTALDKIIEGLKVSKPEALLSVSDAKKEVKKEKKEAEEKNKGKDLSKKKDTDDKTGLPKKDTVEERKDIIKKESESEKEARERAKKELEKENEKAKDVIESQIEKLNRIILEDPALRGFNTGTSATGGGKSTPLIDAERKAIPRGRRVSQKGRKNQYGASAGGRVYWENRENRSDRKSPDYPTGKPYLEKGGNVYASDDLYEVKMVQDGVELDSKLIRARNKGEARMIFEDMYQEKYQDEFGAFDLEIEIAKDRMADGGGIPYKPYGKTKGRFTLNYEDDGEQQSEIWSSLEEATNSARRYVNPKLGYTNVHIYDESGKEYFFADGGEVLKTFRHKHIPTMTYEVVDYTSNGYKGIQKDSKSLSAKERKEGKIAYYSKSEIKELFDEEFAKGGMMADGGKVDKRILEKVYESYDIYKDGTNREHYYDFDNIEKVKEHIEKRTGMEVLKIKEIEIGRNYPDNMSHPYYHDDYEFELVKGQPLRVERMYGRPNYSGNVAYTNMIEVKNLWQMADGGMLDDEGNLIDIKIGDEVVEYKKRTPNATEKTPIGPKGRVIKIMDNFAKVSFPNDYEENILLRDLKKMSKGGMMADGVDYVELINLIKSADNPRNLPIYYNSDSNVVNIGGVGYDKAELVKMFNARAGQSLEIKNLFYQANQYPQETKNRIESMNVGIEVEIGKGYGNETFVKYIKMSKGGMMADGGYIESGEKLYEIANNMSDEEFQEAYRKLSGKEKDLYETLLRLGDDDKIALVTVLNESKKPKYDKSTWDLHRYAKGGLVEEIKMFDKYNYPIPKTKGDKVRAIFEHFKKKGYSTEEINTALGKMNYAKGGSVRESGYYAYPSGDEGNELGVFKDKESMISFAVANKDKYGKLIFEGIQNDDILEVKKGDSKDVITWVFSRIGMDTKEANKKIKTWFISNYPADEEEAKQIDESVTFDDIWFDLKDQRGIYDRLRNPYVVREVFEKIASIYGVEYDFVEKIYKRESYAKGGEMADGGEMELYYVKDSNGNVKNISKTNEDASKFLEKSLKYNGSIGYAVVPKEDWEKEKVTVANIKQYAKGGIMADGGETDDDDTEDERLSMGESVYFEVFNDDGKDGIIVFRNDGSNIIEALISGDIRRFTPKRYMSYLTKKDLQRYLNRDFNYVEEVDEEYVQNILLQEEKNKPSDIMVVKYPYPEVATTPDTLTIIKDGERVFDYEPITEDFTVVSRGLTYPDQIELRDFLEDSKSVSPTQYTPELINIIEVIQANEDINEIVNELKSKGLIKNYIDLEKGREMADGGEVDFSERMAKMRSAYENLQMSVKGKIASAIGIDEAVAIMDTDYSIHPFNLIFGAVRGGLLELDEINKDLVNEAVDEAERVTDDYKDSGQGIGGSDMTYFTQNVLNSAGYKTGFINNTLKRVDADGNELVIDKYEMKF